GTPRDWHPGWQPGAQDLRTYLSRVKAAVSSRLTGQQEGTTSEEVHHVPWSSSFASSHMV
ncbi:unnamed protein product, partial [Effrenium voratum]